jgi:hypothetical protein
MGLGNTRASKLLFATLPKLAFILIYQGMVKILVHLANTALVERTLALNVRRVLPPLRLLRHVLLALQGNQ